ncbi:MAG: hypothetical protein ACFCD0_15860 [Gemmataceae bacterium]
MLRRICLPLIGGVLLLAMSATLVQAGDDEMVENPRYKYWANFKKNATVVHVEKVMYNDDTKQLVPGGVAKKVITYKLVKVTPKAALVRTVVKEQDFLSTIQSAPTTIIYPAKVKKAYLAALINEAGAKVKDIKVKYKGKEYPCKLLMGKTTSGEQEIEFKKWISTEVPGGIFKQVRVARQGGEVQYEATITVTKIVSGKE